MAERVAQDPDSLSSRTVRISDDFGIGQVLNQQGNYEAALKRFRDWRDIATATLEKAPRISLG